MNLIGAFDKAGLNYFPRASGDEPELYWMLSGSGAFSPREWG